MIYTLNLLHETSDSKFVTRKWNIVNDQSNANYDVGNEIIYNLKVLKSNHCDYNEAYNLVTRKWNIVNDQSNANYDVGNEIIYNLEVLKSNHCDYNEAYNLVRGDIITTGYDNPTPVALKNCAPFIY